ncbi:MAG: fibronectin type III domain-containing protein [Methyloceanibacter sp.]
MIWLGLLALGLIAAGLALNAWWPLWGWSQDPLPKPPDPPIIQSANGTGVNTITLTWSDSSPPNWPVLKFQVERMKLPEEIIDILDVASSPSPVSFDDTGLAVWTFYRYRVRTVYTPGHSEWSAPKGARTLPFMESFGSTLTEDEEGWEGYTLVQRIEAGRLNRSGKQIRLTLRAASTSSVSIDRIYLSRASPIGDPYDSEADLKEFYGKVVIPANTYLTLSDTQPDVRYDLDEGQPLLIAVDFSPGSPSGIRFTDAVPPEQASAYWQAGAEASLRDRSSGYNSANRIYLIERIEVG